MRQLPVVKYLKKLTSENMETGLVEYESMEERNHVHTYKNCRQIFSSEQSETTVGSNGLVIAV